VIPTITVVMLGCLNRDKSRISAIKSDRSFVKFRPFIPERIVPGSDTPVLVVFTLYPEPESDTQIPGLFPKGMESPSDMCFCITAFFPSSTSPLDFDLVGKVVGSVSFSSAGKTRLMATSVPLRKVDNVSGRYTPK
jgi:hypothetical protein